MRVIPRGARRCPAKGRDPDLLKDIFSLSSDAAFSTPHRPEPGPETEEETTVEITAPELNGNGSMVLSRVRTGFRLRGRVGDEGPGGLEVLAAYQLLRGNPFRRYSPLDFRMDKTIAVKAHGARVVARQDNRLELEIEDREFDVLVTRFDEHRDVLVKVRPLEGQQ